MIMALMATDFPLPVEPAISTCGMVVRSAVTMRPLMSLPIASVSSSTSGASTKQMASLTRNAEKTPEVATTPPSRIKGARAHDGGGRNGEETGQPQAGDHDHDAEQQGDGIEVDGPIGILERQSPGRDHEARAHQRDAGAIDPQPRNPADGKRQITRDEDDDGGHARAVFTERVAAWEQPGRHRSRDGDRDHEPGKHRQLDDEPSGAKAPPRRPALKGPGLLPDSSYHPKRSARPRR